MLCFSVSLSYLFMYHHASVVITGHLFDFVHRVKPSLSNTDASKEIPPRIPSVEISLVLPVLYQVQSII